jgi:glutamate synthase domain-containing protein 2/glutamate synthase domain-containing protein 1/glutamate synthase domain-containing protein 3
MAIGDNRRVTSPSFLPRYDDHDACGVALVADVAGRRSHELLTSALIALERMAHRGGGTTMVDGCGVLATIPWALIDDGAPALSRLRALGTFFIPHGSAPQVQALFEPLAHAEGWRPRRWRLVPTATDVLRPDDRATAPQVVQVECVWTGPGERLARLALWRLRLRLRFHFATAGLDASIVSLSADTVVYKGVLTPAQLPQFYPDLRDSRFDPSAVVVHQRFSTNTESRWDLVQPFRLVAHNGEINTITGNRARMAARCRNGRVHGLGWIEELGEVVTSRGSDSESLDDAVGLLCATGADLPRAVGRLIRPAWEQDADMPPKVRAMYACDALRTEPWEGPAAVAFSNGLQSGAVLDSSGFRPLRWLRTSDGLLCLASEAGVWDVPESAIVERRRVGPGEMVMVDAAHRVLRSGAEVRAAWTTGRPYAGWLRQGVAALTPRELVPESETMNGLRQAHRRFGYDREEIDVILRPMVCHDTEAVGSMGDDTAPAALTTRPRLLQDYFRQRFAQVTNPPIDALRETLVTSLTTRLGAQPALADDIPSALVLSLESPILGISERQALRGPRTVELSAVFDVRAGLGGMTAAMDSLAHRAERAVVAGALLLVISDRQAAGLWAALPAPLALAVVRERLTAQGRSTDVSLIVETAEARDAHHLAVLTSLGAQAVYPHLALRTAAALCPEAPAQGQARLLSALSQGLLKIMAKSGVSTFDAYCGAGLVEILGLDREVMRRYFPHIRGIAGGVDLARLHADTCARHEAAQTAGTGELSHTGFHGFRKDGDYHAWNPEVVKALQKTTASRTAEAYMQFATLVTTRPPTAVRDLLTLAPATPIPVDEVESVAAICRRFFGSAMSVGALSPEAHAVVSGAMHEVGGRGNSGEGGEDPGRAWPRRGAGATNSAIKQIASGRFGVTPAYLISADELQIKMAQGSKPGEGGQLPARKVTEQIARLRHTRPGTALISPPPHHDIYSIEDLAQLIHDLRTFHPTARISVKLVATSGIGIVAAGVVKAGAHAIQISGHDGGTGASPRGSIKGAGQPWEYGLAEAHRVLTARGLRQRVTLQVDGGCKTGVDVVKAALLGADEVGFGTSLLVAAGCVMCRQCHADTCPVGIASQRPELRGKFAGTIEQVAAYLRLTAEHVRVHLAQLGLRHFGEAVGRVDLLRTSAQRGAASLDLDDLIRPLGASVSMAAPPREVAQTVGAATVTLNDRLVDACLPRLGRAPILLASPIVNTDRSVGARLAGVLAERYGNAGSPETIRLTFTGTAGQSFGAFMVPGMHLSLEGEANDGVGKGMHGGLIAIRPRGSRRTRRPDVIVGNSALYGATGGTLYAAGEAGERFAVRNSGATAVVEGVGDHACEYMTGGLVIVLGRIGRNFGAGMTGGRAVLVAPPDGLAARLHQGSVDVVTLDSDEQQDIRTWVEHHAAATHSALAIRLLRRWTDQRAVLVVPQADAVLRSTPVPTEDRTPWIYANSRF